MEAGLRCVLSPNLFFNEEMPERHELFVVMILRCANTLHRDKSGPVKDCSMVPVT